MPKIIHWTSQTKRFKPSRLPHAAWLLDLAFRYASNQDIKKAIDRAEAAVSVMRVGYRKKLKCPIIVTFRFAAEESDNVEELIYDTSQCVSDLLRKQLGRDPECRCGTGK